MVFAQALINPNGPAGECIERGARAEFTIVLSRQVIAEIVELPEKIPAKYLLTDAKVAAFLAGLVPASRIIEQVPHVFDHPIDPDDSAYIDLAVAAGASLIVSRDKHLLGLNDPQKPWSADFRRRFPDLKTIKIETFLDLLRAQSGPP
jgi:putative PIN family toxin of toxin-antitoxin system